ncbi:MAG TPA: tetratricopeptide repeat protein [Vitreimonas sp.]|uniref:tetratricopeptide repeat protein n=1 Tax=Vitreimonas sp. TaxID=3069702 RepID=UPI002D35CC10|nr:tetratricopeptide repeat protein [Vitreimonas sp.]HYD87068.1 tetratricopeptide repeat protein [Vitreimonas sp.]
MALKDRYGNPASTQSQAAMQKYDEALDLIRLYRGDPVAALDAALAEDPDFGGAWAARAGLLVTATDKAYAEETERSLRAGAAANLNERERMHLQAAQDWAEGRYIDGTMRYGRIAQDNPRDVLALQYAHVGCFFVGMQSELRDWPLQALRAFKRGEEGCSYIQGMAAFGLEECGDFARADIYGRQAVEADPRDGWAVHAVAHVNEMRGDLDTGIPWLANNAQHWAPESGFAYHNWWHLGLLYLDKGDTGEVLKLYDEKVRPDPTAQVMLEWIDASAMLWRLHLEGVDVGDRFEKLAACWQRAGEDAFYAFNDLHAVMAFLGAGRATDAERTLKAMRKAAADGGDNGYMTRKVGLPLAEAFVAFEAGRYGEALEKIAATRGLAQRFGGSHAQRDILSLTAMHAALRGGFAAAAEAIAAERLAHKPQSPWAGRLARQARELSAKQRAA